MFANCLGSRGFHPSDAEFRVLRGARSRKDVESGAIFEILLNSLEIWNL